MPEQTVQTPEPVLDDGVIYYAHDRFVCTQCCGVTALYTGATIGGAPVLPIEPGDVVEWVLADQETGGKLGPLHCEGQHLQAQLTPGAPWRMRFTKVGA